ncbi:kinase-like domain-containing protein [Thamnocephalis sphaerospora]|uniref:Kinase-like domain-containing protein n=1 Tax=Thamnocephalis sphaerospora TaxID=78915 RepID=A0A4P9XGL5_9FUNG|nr:kinase-like domain-containing protein [Thamnocephalis sphaerospora]|eukprot:RKP04371.1 kinase-like domain-containing protein [Thamnocephalis sphaerospora]
MRSSLLDERRRGFEIYKYKTVDLSPSGDSFIDSTAYIEASAAFCNQVDLVRERLGQNHDGIRNADREAKRKRLNELSAADAAVGSPAKRARGAGGQRGRGAAGGRNNNVGTRGDRGNADSVQMALEKANVISRGSFRSLHSETPLPTRYDIDARDSASNTDSESTTDSEQPFEPPSWMACATDTAGQQLFIKVFNDICFGRHEIWMNELILYAEKLRSRWPSLRKHTPLDGRITRVVWTGECDGSPVLVMKAEQEADQPISTPMQLAGFAQNVAKTLAILHDDVKVVHGDIKPSNLIVAKNGSDDRPVQVVVCDFGSAHPIKDDAKPSAPIYSTGGTKDYCAPERDEHNPAPASDVYSLGATLCDIMVGQKIECEPIHVYVAKMLDPVPKKRPRARDVAKKFKSIQKKLETLGLGGVDVFGGAHAATSKPVSSTELRAGGSGTSHRSGSRNEMKRPSLVSGSSGSDTLVGSDPLSSRPMEYPHPKVSSSLEVVAEDTSRQQQAQKLKTLQKTPSNKRTQPQRRCKAS